MALPEGFWRRSLSYSEIHEIFSDCEPDANVWDRQGIPTRFPDLYRSYVFESTSACLFDNSDGQILALAIIAWLPKTQTIYIETFSVNRKIRQKGYARMLYDTMRSFIVSDWPEILQGCDTTLIEVYLHNVIAWEKIMGVSILDIEDNPDISIATPVKIMGRNLKDPKESYREWQDFQKQWKFQMSNT